MSSPLTAYQRIELRDLEQRVFEEGVDGGEATSEAIRLLKDKEKEYGVYNENAVTDAMHE